MSNKPLGMYIEVDAGRLTRFLESGHPRSMRLILGAKDKDGAFGGLEVSKVTVDGLPVENSGRTS